LSQCSTHIQGLAAIREISGSDRLGAAAPPGHGAAQ
jgi:hypothetical protein